MGRGGERVDLELGRGLGRRCGRKEVWPPGRRRRRSGKSSRGSTKSQRGERRVPAGQQASRPASQEATKNSSSGAAGAVGADDGAPSPSTSSPL